MATAALTRSAVLWMLTVKTAVAAFVLKDFPRKIFIQNAVVSISERILIYNSMISL